MKWWVPLKGAGAFRVPFRVLQGQTQQGVMRCRPAHNLGADRAQHAGTAQPSAHSRVDAVNDSLGQRRRGDGAVEARDGGVQAGDQGVGVPASTQSGAGREVGSLCRAASFAPTACCVACHTCQPACRAAGWGGAGPGGAAVGLGCLPVRQCHTDRPPIPTEGSWGGGRPQPGPPGGELASAHGWVRSCAGQGVRAGQAAQSTQTLTRHAGRHAQHRRWPCRPGPAAPGLPAPQRASAP